ncbi:MAG: WD40 repeat domain-containing protein [Candidatus Coatesbacteria bacterium]|nr:WD40 repeat domain-containing protein [Candidatus Coatesbacteria bacterium]
MNLPKRSVAWVILLFSLAFVITCARDNPFDENGDSYKGPYDVPKLETPANGATLERNSTTLTWKLNNPSGMKVRYEVYLGTDGNLYKANQGFLDSTYFQVSNLEPDEKYRWQIVAISERETNEKSDIWEFTSGRQAENQSPIIEITNPGDHDAYAVTYFDISWYSDDPDGDTCTVTLKYDKDKNPNNGFEGTIIENYPDRKEYRWDVSSVPEGGYYIYALIDDGKSTRSIRPVTINNIKSQNVNLKSNLNKKEVVNEINVLKDGNVSNLNYKRGKLNPTRAILTPKNNTGNISTDIKTPDKIGLTGENYSNSKVIVDRSNKNHPPNPPYNPNPRDGSSNNALQQSLRWDCEDPDGNDLTYDIFFGREGDMVKVADKVPNKNYETQKLTKSTSYKWQIIAFDSRGDSTIGRVWTFTTTNADFEAYDPDPENNAIGIPLDKFVSWDCNDMNATFDVYIGTSQNPQRQSRRQSDKEYDPVLEPDTTYYWKIVSFSSGDSITGPLWSFRTKRANNHPPNPPYDPDPENNATDIPLNKAMTWKCEDPDSFEMGGLLGQSLRKNRRYLNNDLDQRDSLWYSVYFGTTSNPEYVGKVEIAFYKPPEDLSSNTKYYWRIVAHDSQGDSASGSLWNFTTGTQRELWIRVTKPPAGGAEADSLYTIEWEYDAPGSSSPKVSLYYDTDSTQNANEVLIKENILAQDKAYTWNCKEIPEGSYYILAIIDDGLMKTSRYYLKKSSIIDITKPIKKLLKPETSFDYSDGALKLQHYTKPGITITQPPAEGATADSVYRIEWTYNTYEGTSPIVYLYTDNDSIPGGEVLIQAAIPTDSLGYTWNCDSMPNGSWYIKGVIDDRHTGKTTRIIFKLHNNVARPDTTYDYSDGKLTIDHGYYTPPTITVTDPPEEGATADSTYTIKWNFSASQETSPVVDLYYDSDNQRNGNEVLIQTEIPADSLEYEWDLTGLSEGSYYVLAVIDDKHTSSFKYLPKRFIAKPDSSFDYSDGTLTVRRYTPPNITITRPPAQGATADTSYTIEWTYSSYQGTSPIVNLYTDNDVSPGGEVLIRGSIPAEELLYTWKCDSMPNGSWYIKGVIDDGYTKKTFILNKTSKFFNFSQIVNNIARPDTAHDYSDGRLTIDHYYYTPPTITITAPPADNDTADASYTIRWNYSASQGMEPVVDLYYDSDNVRNGNETLISSGIPAADISYDWNISSMTEGDYYILGVIDDGYSKSSKYLMKNRIARPDSSLDYSDGTLTILHYMPPSIMVTRPPAQGDSADLSYRIEWNYTSFQGTTPVVNLYTDNDRSPGGEILIASNIPAANLNYTWSCDSMPECEIYIKAVIDDQRTTSFTRKLTDENGVISFNALFEGFIKHPDTAYDYSDGTLEIIHAGMKRMFTGHTDEVYSVSISSDRLYFMSASLDRTARYWRISDGSTIRSISHPDAVLSVCISKDGNFALTGCADDSLRYWELSTGNLIRTFGGDNGNVLSVDISSNDLYAVSGNQNNNASYWDLSTGTLIRDFTGGHTSYVNQARFSSDSNYIITGGEDNRICHWQVSNGSLLGTMTGHSQPVNSVFLTSDNMYALSGSQDNTVGYWNISTYTNMNYFTGHTNSVNSVFVTPNNRFVLSGSSDNSLRYIEISSGNTVRTFTNHTAAVNSVEISNDGKYAISGSSDNTIIYWRLPF